MGMLGNWTPRLTRAWYTCVKFGRISCLLSNFSPHFLIKKAIRFWICNTLGKTRWVRVFLKRNELNVPLYSSWGCWAWKWVASWSFVQQPAYGKACCTCPWECRGDQVKRRWFSTVSSAIGAKDCPPLFVHYNKEHKWCVRMHTCVPYVKVKDLLLVTSVNLLHNFIDHLDGRPLVILTCGLLY